jgi:hypothetical protein
MFEECTICAYELHQNLLVTSCCNQLIHKNCFNNCLIYNNARCPFCRQIRHDLIVINIQEIIAYNNTWNNIILKFFYYFIKYTILFISLLIIIDEYNKIFNNDITSIENKNNSNILLF